MRSLLWAVAILLIVVGVAVGLVTAGVGVPLLRGEPEAQAEPITRLYGGGSSFIKPLMTVWCDRYAKSPNGKPLVYYESVGSGRGIRSMLNRDFDFGATDAFIPTIDLEKAQGANGDIIHMPLAMGAVVIAYNLPKVTQLRLDPDTLAGIFTRKITKWNDPALVELNPDTKLPDLPISVATRIDSSGTTAAFTEYLSLASPKVWGPKFGTLVEWAAGTVPAKGNEKMADHVRDTPGSVGYVELTYADQHGLTMALLKNRDGSYPRPTSASVSAAAAAAISGPQVPGDLRISLLNLGGEDTYPISVTVYAVIYVKQKPEKAKVLVDFFRWVTHDGQQYCVEKKYVQLPESLIKKIEPMLSRIGK